ncbi:MAG TPA: ABC transporter permease [Stellaceae bacterium]|jgi:peptide/nickel transport system permease protein|nr:ABC transporter permease [Stellaceae bacterium]
MSASGAGNGIAARLLRSRAFMTGAVLLTILLAMAAGADLLYPDDPLGIAGRPTLWPGINAQFPLGTDMLGRDMAAEIFHGARISLTIGFAAAAISLSIGVLIGVTAGYVGGPLGEVLMRITEFFQTIPSFLFAIVLVVILQPSIESIVLAIGVTTWPQIARLARAEVLRVRRADYVLAAVTMGRRPTRIVIDHVLPNSLAPVVVATSVLVANAILVEASLSFLSLGDPNSASWGAMIGAGREVLRTAWYMSAVPGAAVFVTVMGFTLLGNGLNDVLNPRGADR